MNRSGLSVLIILNGVKELSLGSTRYSQGKLSGNEREMLRFAQNDMSSSCPCDLVILSSLS